MLSHLNNDAFDSFCLPALFGRFTKYEENLYTTTEYVDDTDIECAVCLCQKVGYLRQLDCGHSFHNCCVNTWLTQKQTCPECRSAVSDEYLKENCEPTSSTPDEFDEDSSIYFTMISNPHYYPHYNYYAPRATIKEHIIDVIRVLLDVEKLQQKQVPVIIYNNQHKPKKSYKKYERRNENKRNSKKDLNRSNKLIRKQR